MFLRIKPRIIMFNKSFYKPDDGHEQVKLKSCPKSPDMFGGCDQWNEGEGSQKCCDCIYAEWEVVK